MAPVPTSTEFLRLIGSRVRAAREAKAWSQSELAAAADLNKETVNRIELGANTSMESLIRVAGALGENIGRWMATASGGDDVHDERVDVSGYVKDDLPVIFEGEASPRGLTYWDDEGTLLPAISDRISRPAGLNDKQAYGVRVRGDSMRPKYEPGDVLVVSPNLPVRTGLRCYVQLKSGERLIKQVRRTMAGWLLESINQAYESREVRDDEIEFMHRIVWAREKGDAPKGGGELRIVDEQSGRRVMPDETFSQDERAQRPKRRGTEDKEDRHRFRGDDRDRSDEV